MTFTRLVALIIIFAFVADGSPALRAGLIAAARTQPMGLGQAAAPLTISGTLFRPDGTTPAANVGVQLRNVDTGQIVAKTVTDQAGQFVFPAQAAGLYVVEILDQDGKVLAVGAPLQLSTTPLTTSLMMPAATAGAGAGFFTSTTFIVLSAITGAGIATLIAVNTGDDEATVSSPEQ
jgi:hypothetical protein